MSGLGVESDTPRVLTVIIGVIIFVGAIDRDSDHHL